MNSILCTVTTDLQAKNAKGYTGVQKHTEHDPNIKHSNQDINFDETQFNVYNEGLEARNAVKKWNDDKFNDFVSKHDEHQRSMGHPERCYGSVQGYLKNRRKVTGVLTIGNMNVQAQLIERFCPTTSYDVEVLADGTKRAKFKLYDSSNKPIKDNITVAKQFYDCFNRALINATNNNVGWKLKNGNRVNVGDYVHRGRYATNNDEMGISHIHYEVATYGLTKGGKMRKKAHATSSLSQSLVTLHHAVTGKFCSSREAFKWYRAQMDKYALKCLENELHRTYRVSEHDKILTFERKTSEDPSTMTGLSMTQLKKQKQELTEHQQAVNTLQTKANELSEQNKNAQKRIEKVQQLNDVAKAVMSDVKDTYQVLTGNQMDNATSSLEVAKAVKKASDAIKKDAVDYRQRLKRQKQQIAQQQAELTRLRTEQSAIAHSNQELQEDNKRLRDSNSKLEERLKYLQAQVKTAGLVIGKWVRRNWNSLEKHFKKYATYINDANHERWHGGPDGHGDIYQANKFEEEAKNGLISAFDGIQKQELQKSGYFDDIVKTDSNKNKDNELEK